MDINFRNRFQGESFEYCFNNDTQMGWIKVKTDKDCYVFETKRKSLISKIQKYWTRFIGILYNFFNMKCKI